MDELRYPYRSLQADEELVRMNEDGMLFHGEERFDKSLEQFWTALQRSREMGYREWESMALNNIGMVYHSWGKYDHALKFYNQSLQLALAIGFSKGESIMYNNLGRLYDSWGRMDKALEYYEHSCKISDKIQDLPNKRTSLLNMVVCYEKLGDFNECEKFLKEVIQIDEVIGHPNLAADQAYLQRLKARI